MITRYLVAITMLFVSISMQVSAQGYAVRTVDSCKCDSIAPHDSLGSVTFWKAQKSWNLFCIMRICGNHTAGQMAYSHFTKLLNSSTFDKSSCYCEARRIYETSFGREFISYVFSMIDNDPSISGKFYNRFLTDYAEEADSVSQELIVRKLFSLVTENKIKYDGTDGAESQLWQIFYSKGFTYSQKKQAVDFLLHNQPESFLNNLVEYDYREIPCCKEEIYGYFTLKLGLNSSTITKLIHVFPDKVKDLISIARALDVTLSSQDLKSLIKWDPIKGHPSMDSIVKHTIVGYQVCWLQQLDRQDELTFPFLIKLARPQYYDIHVSAEVKDEAKNILRNYRQDLENLWDDK